MLRRRWLVFDRRFFGPGGLGRWFGVAGRRLALRLRGGVLLRACLCSGGRLVGPAVAVLMVEGWGCDGARLVFAQVVERGVWVAGGRALGFSTRWDPRRRDGLAWVD